MAAAQSQRQRAKTEPPKMPKDVTCVNTARSGSAFVQATE